MADRSGIYSELERAAAVKALDDIREQLQTREDGFELAVDAVAKVFGLRRENRIVPEWGTIDTVPRGVEQEIIMRLIGPDGPREVHAVWWKNWESDEIPRSERWCWREIAADGNGARPVGPDIDPTQVRWWKPA